MKINSPKISGVIITFNEERNIARCIKSLNEICDEIIVVDSFSTDKTKTICKTFDVRFIEHPFEGHIQQKNYALSQTKNDLVLSLDADEALSTELQESIKKALPKWNGEAIQFNRFTNYCGQWIKHCGWYPDRKVRLWNKKTGHWGGTNPHDSVELKDGIKVSHLSGDILHFSYYTLEEHITRSSNYAKIAAKAMRDQGKSSSYSKIIFNSSFRFFRDYFLKSGFRDGFYGFIICAINGHTTFLKYTYLKQLNLGNKIDG